MTQQISFQDIKKLSAYLDNQLSKSAQKRLKARIALKPELQEILLEMRQARGLLRQTPLLRVPHNFRLTPKMVGMRPPVPRSVPVFRMATLTAVILLFLSFTFNFLAPFTSAPNLAAAPQLSQSGGGCGYDDPADCGDVSMEALPLGVGAGSPETATPQEETVMSISPERMAESTPEITPETSQGVNQQPTPDADNASPDLPVLDSPPSEKSQPQTMLQLNSFQIGLILLVFVLGSSAFIIRQINIQRWRKRL
ncbi:MAG: hypothetical protein ABIJ65_07945 [Chloroflexota bacterium]